MSNFLKGNFEVKKPVNVAATEPVRTAAEQLSAELRKKALSSLGGSMVYVDRTELTWDPEAPPGTPNGE